MTSVSCAGRLCMYQLNTAGATAQSIAATSVTRTSNTSAPTTLTNTTCQSGGDMKPKYKITKAQLRKRKKRRLTTKPARQKAKVELARTVSQLVTA